MGQQMKAVQEAVISLQSQNIISSEQAENFLNDYQNQVDIIQDIKKFMKTPCLNIFLKYYIKNKHNTNHIIPQNNVVKFKSKEMRKGELDNIIIKQINDQVIRHYQQFQNRAQQTLKQINELMINRKWYFIKTYLQRILEKYLYFQKYEFICRFKGESISKYNSSLNFLQFVGTQHEKFMQLAKVLDFSENSIKMVQQESSTYLYIKVSTIHWKIFMKVQSNSFLESTFQRDHPEIQHLLYQTIQYLILESLDAGIVANQASKIKVFSSQYLKILQLNFYLQEQNMKTIISNLTNKTISNECTLYSLIENFLEENDQNLNISQGKKKSILTDITKYTTKIEKDFQKFELYLQKIDGCNLFIDFDRYSEMKFISSSRQHNIVIKVAKLLGGKEPTKIHNIFPEYHGLLNTINKAGKGSFKSGTIEQKHQQFSCKLFISSDSILQRIHVEIDQAKTKELDQEWEVNSDQEEENIYSSEQFFQEGKFIQNLEKQHPRIKQEGWLNLFLKDSRKKKKSIKEKGFIKLKTEKLLFCPIEGLNDPDLDIIDFPTKQLQSLVFQIFETNPLFTVVMSQQDSQEKFRKFLTEVTYYYQMNKNPFHNFCHGVNVVHMCYVMVSSAKNEDYLTDEEFFSVLLSGLCHDVGHTGFTNSFQIACFSEKALTYNDRSPLQNYHAAKTLEILSRNNFLSHWDTSCFNSFKKNVIKNILATDIKEHFTLLEKFKNWKSLSKDEALQQTDILTSFIVHSSDLCGPVKSFPIAKSWSEKINAEYQNQHEQQLKLGLDCTQFMKDLNIPKVWYRNQSGFMKVIVVPLYEQLSNFYKEQLSIRKLNENAKSNLEKWEQYYQKQE